MYYPRLNRAIATWCHIHGVTHNRFACMIGIHENSLRNKRYGRRHWTEEDLIAISKITKTPIDELLSKSRKGVLVSDGERLFDRDAERSV